MEIYFLENKNAYTIFKMVKIATAIKKFVQPFIWYETQGIISRDIRKLNTFSTTALIKNTINQKNIKKSGNDNIFIIGRIVIFIRPKIIPPRI